MFLQEGFRLLCERMEVNEKLLALERQARERELGEEDGAQGDKDLLTDTEIRQGKTSE